ncbi:hypothetical protein Lalb_Chr09g0334511 [Lupinus albus]|uniref:Uncharacterized protein n=2 Tax=Lupinus albus TaxID=3870 RepID=A0A6A4Q246_LUPAL|nr:hypothetical protein Lalb_Chr09g0334511 [Lupinus albus]
MRRRRRFVTAGRRRRFVTAGRRRRFGSTVFFSDYLLRYSDAVVPTKNELATIDLVHLKPIS